MYIIEPKLIFYIYSLNSQIPQKEKKTCHQ